CFSRPEQQHMQPPIPEPRLFPRQLHQARAQLFIASCRPIAVTRYRHPHQPANPITRRKYKSASNRAVKRAMVSSESVGISLDIESVYRGAVGGKRESRNPANGIR